MTTWFLNLDDGFQHANTTAGGAGTTTGVPTTPAVGHANGWTDRVGGLFSITSNKVLLTPTGTGSPFATDYLSRPTSEGTTNQRLTVFFDLTPATPISRLAVLARYLGTGAVRYYAHIDTTAGQISCFSVDASGSPTAVGASPTFTYNAAHYYALDFQIVGSALTITAYDQGTSPPAQTGTVPTLGTQVAQITATDTAQAGSTSAVMGLVASGTHASPYSALRALFYTDVGASTGPTLTSPGTNQIFQRSGTTGTISIAGTNSDTVSHSIEASWNGGSFVTIATAVGAGLTFTGALTGQAQGQGTLTVRYVDAPSLSTTVTLVGVGEVFIIAGQSNASGRLTNAQLSQSKNWTNGLFGNDYVWKALADFTDSTASQVDTVSAESGGLTTGGSVWPIVGTQLSAILNVPVAFVPCPLGGTTISQWAPGGTGHQDRTTLYGSMVFRTNTVKGARCILWMQGESDAAAGVSTATYQAALTSLAASIVGDLSIKLMVSRLFNSAGASIATPTNFAKIDAAIVAAVPANPTTMLLGPNQQNLTVDDGFAHITTDANAAASASLWTNAVIAAFFAAGGIGTYPLVNQVQLGVIYGPTGNLVGTLPPGFVQPTTTRTVSVTVKNASGALVPNTVFKCAWFDESTPNTLTYPTDQFASVMTDANSNLLLTVHSALLAGGVGSMILSNTDGITTTAAIDFYGPVQVA